MLEEVFKKKEATVLLCNVHTRRYFKDKVLTNKGFWGDISKQHYLNSKDKDRIIHQLTLVRDSPSESVYIEAERRLFERTDGLSVRPGQANAAVTFHEYYSKNWKPEDFRWVKVFRKNLPIDNVNDTQAAESTFSAIKRMIRSKFNGSTPTLVDLLRILPQLIDDR